MDIVIAQGHVALFGRRDVRCVICIGDAEAPHALCLIAVALLYERWQTGNDRSLGDAQGLCNGLLCGVQSVMLQHLDGQIDPDDMAVHVGEVGEEPVRNVDIVLSPKGDKAIKVNRTELPGQR